MTFLLLLVEEEDVLLALIPVACLVHLGGLSCKRYCWPRRKRVMMVSLMV